MQRLTMINL